ncbi:thiol:disulfide interchange protein DsbG [Paraburkholderia tropica]|uniref:thiol:disulfide interchange protein DsbG n=1 Tax=Paraburkholderia tropica TaxID=92647 RepID=UPI002AB5F529|nr:thiol:disulfide interchange protein DsbG [Paraburkholderia tropica]
MSNRPFLPRILCTGLLLCVSAAYGQSMPPAVSALSAQGITIKGRMTAPAGFEAYVGEHDGQHLPIYLLPDHQHVVIGELFDAQGRDLTSGPFSEAATPALDAAIWDRLAQTKWVAEGPASTRRIVYVFTDTECPYCHQLWTSVQPYVAQGDVQVRYIMVAVIAPASLNRGAAILEAKNPSAALVTHEQSFGHSPIAPEASVPEATKQTLLANTNLMLKLGVAGTPATVYRDAQGAVHLAQGALPPDVVKTVFGP